MVGYLWTCELMHALKKKGFSGYSGGVLYPATVFKQGPAKRSDEIILQFWGKPSNQMEKCF